MSVIVKGMEMPKSCADCFAISEGLDWCKATGSEVFNPFPKDDLPSFCPLSPLPEKHGRLIEADSLKETLDYYIREVGWDTKTNRVLGWVKDDFIDAERTVVEGEDKP